MTKGKNIKSFVKSQPLFLAVSLDVSDRFTGLSFTVEYFNVLLIVSTFSLIIIRFYLL